MPHVIIKLLAGRSEPQKARIAEAVCQAIIATTGNGIDAVSVSIEDVQKDAWAEVVLPGRTSSASRTGVGWIQREGGAVEEMRAGDVVWTPPGVKHWHGAAATTGMTHIALTEQVDGQVATWMEQVSDEQYRR